MAGIYLHIPFCKQACYYCDFHFSTSLNSKQAIVQAIAKELHLQKEYLGNEVIHSIYFGGGTPSLLEASDFELLFDAIFQNYSIGQETEITLEANPDDLSIRKLELFKHMGVNRLSIGVQSFHDGHLKYLNRAHNSIEAKESLSRARKTGFDNLSIDLIYAIPAPDHGIWENDLDQALMCHPEHISSYCLTIEPGTAFGNWLKKGKINAVEDEFAVEQFEILMGKLSKNGYEQYEISNFCLAGFHSRHNSNYWRQEKYLGVGPSAHSFDGKNRQFNISNNMKYLKYLSYHEVPFELDMLKAQEHLNEYIMTSLRTNQGCDLLKIKDRFRIDIIVRNKTYIEELLNKKLAKIDHYHLILTDKGKLLADQISSDLFITGE